MVPLASSAYGFLPHAVDESQIDQVVRPQRLRPRSQTVRSSSGGRQTMYFSEVDVEPKIPPTNYNYIRSSEDISSGYSSAEPISGGLSRTSSMTNTTRPRFKAKRAEDESSAGTDEYDNSGNIRTPMHSSPYMTPYKINPNTEAGRATCQFFDNLGAWKDDAFFSNQRYYQDHETTGKQEGSELDARNMSPEMLDKYAMFCKWLDGNEINKKTGEELMKDTNKDQSPEKMDGNIQLAETKDSKKDQSPEKTDGYIQLVKEQRSHSPPRNNTEEEFKDTISTASGDDEFLDVIPENKEEVIEKDKDDISQYVDAEKNDGIVEEIQISKESEDGVKSPIKRLDAFAKVVVLDSENSNSQPKTEISQETQTRPDLIPDSVNETSGFTDASDGQTQNNIEVPQGERKTSLPIESLIENLAKETETTLSVLKTNLENSGTIISVNMSPEVAKPSTMGDQLTDSSLDLSKRPASHSKGKAPVPPEQLTKSSRLENLPQAPPPPPSSPSRSEIPPSSFRDFTSSLKTPNPVTSPASHSRSPSPKPEGKSKSKKSLFKNYLPSLFRSDPSKQTPGISDEYHKETQI